MMLQRVSAVVAMQWSWYDDKTNCWIIPPDTTVVKRTFGDKTNAHVIPQTPQLETLMNNLDAINGHQKMFSSVHTKAIIHISHLKHQMTISRILDIKGGKMLMD